MTIKEQLAKRIEDDLCDGKYYVDPKELRTNKGPRWAMDIFSWNGVVRLYPSGPAIYSVGSYDSMTELVKKKTPLIWIGRDHFEIS